MDLPARYEDDIYAWSLHQTAVLRRMAAGDRTRLPNDLDIENVIEEIETVGRSELAAVRSHLTRMLEHVVKAACSPASYPRALWMSEVAREQGEAEAGFTRSMRQHLDLERIWRQATRLADAGLRARDEALPPLPEACPFALEELLDLARAPEAFVAQLATLIQPPAGG